MCNSGWVGGLITIHVKARLDTFRSECQLAGNKVNDPNTSQKIYWKIINTYYSSHKCRAPKIPPLLVNNVFILSCRDKAKSFNDFFRISAGLSLIVIHYPH